MPSRPNRELKKIKIAAVPLAPFTVVHPAKRISGDKKIPPPVPVKPDKNPITAPTRTASHML